MRTPESLRAIDAAREIVSTLRSDPTAYLVEIVEATFYGEGFVASALACRLIETWRMFDHDEAAPYIHARLEPGSVEARLAESFPHDDDEPPHKVRCPKPLTVRIDFGGPRSPAALDRPLMRVQIAATFRRRTSREGTKYYRVEVEPNQPAPSAEFVRWLDAAIARLDEIEAVFGTTKRRLPDEIRSTLHPTGAAVFDILSEARSPMTGKEIRAALDKLGATSGSDEKQLSERIIPRLREAIAPEGYRIENERGSGYFLTRATRGVAE
jgi:hypothetical protein